MPTVLPFAGLRYAVPAAELGRLLSPPYDVIGPIEQALLQAQSPYNASYVELPSDTAGRAGSRYLEAAERLAIWQRDGVLVSDPRPAYYFSQTEFVHAGAALRRRDVLAALGVQPWSTGMVRPHEHTMSAPKADRLELLRSTHVNAAPIWVLHRYRLAALDQAWATAAASPPTSDFTWRDERHQVWVVDDPATVHAIADAFDRAGPLYIADGHHRYETSLAFRAEAEASVPGASATFAAVTWADDPGLLVLPTHRLLHAVDPTHLRTRCAHLFHVDYHRLSPDTPAEQLEALLQRLASSGRTAPSFGVFTAEDPEQFAILRLREGPPAEDALPVQRSAAWRSLDVSLVHALLIDPLVADTGRPREEVLSYTRHATEAVATVRDGGAAAAFFLNPTPVRGVLAVADARDLMPEKSTFFWPKPPAGVVMRSLEEAS